MDESTTSEPANNLLFNQSLAKGLAVLGAFGAQRRTMSLAEVAEAAGMSKSSAQRAIFTLEQLGYISKHPVTRRFRLTLRSMQIGFNYLAADVLIDIANPFLAELCQVTGETTNLTEPDGYEMVYVARFVSTKFVPVHMPIGSRLPMYCTASGRAWLAGADPQRAAALLGKMHLIKSTPHTLTSVPEILDRLEEARRLGYAYNREELFIGDMTIASAIKDAKGNVVGSVHVVAPTSRWTLEEARAKLAPAVIDCARSISTSIRALELG